MTENPGLPAVQVVGFLGPAALRDEAAVGTAVGRRLQALRAAGPRLLALSPLAGPADLLFAREALRAEIPLVLLLLPSAEECARNFPASSREELDAVLQKAVRTETMALPAHVSAHAHLIPRLVDECDVLMVIGEDVPESVTTEVMAYAARRGRSLISLRESPGGVREEEIPAGSAPAQTAADVEALSALLGEPGAAPVIPEEVVRFFEARDREATRTAPRVRRQVLNIVLANAIASLAGAVGSSFPHSPAVGTLLTAVKFGAVILGLGIFALLRHRQSQNTWLKLRLEAEICRSTMATWNSPRPVEPLSTEEAPEMRGLIRSLNYLRTTRAPRPGISLEAFKADYGRRRLDDQHRYFHAQSRAAARVSSRLSPLYWIFSAAALLTSALSVFVASHLVPGTWLNFFFVIVPIVAPIFASWIVSWQAIESVGRRKARFAEMERLTGQALVDLVHCHSWEAVHHVVKKTERTLLNEVLEWYSFVKYK